MPYCVDKSLLIVCEPTSKSCPRDPSSRPITAPKTHFLSDPNQMSKYILDSRVFLAQPFGNSFAQYRQSYAFAAARPVLQATDASFKFQVSFQASKFDLLLVCTRLVSKRSIRLVFVFVGCSRRMREEGRDAVVRQFVEGSW
jgi:hypothetical protein